jgi:hypothetical protein
MFSPFHLMTIDTTKVMATDTRVMIHCSTCTAIPRSILTDEPTKAEDRYFNAPVVWVVVTAASSEEAHDIHSRDSVARLRYSIYLGWRLSGRLSDLCRMKRQMRPIRNKIPETVSTGTRICDWMTNPMARSSLVLEVVLLARIASCWTRFSVDWPEVG